jgi:hypothetical protein
MGVGPRKRLVTLGVNALARETGLPRQTISDRMKRGATASDVRAYARMRERRPPERPPAAVSKHREAPKFREPRLEFDATPRARGRLEAIDDARLRRTRALAEKLEFENQQLRSRLIPRVYLEEWTKRFLRYAREVLLKGPSELSKVLATEADPLKCNEVLSSWVRQTMAKLAETDEVWAPTLNAK